jgi:hypothetical protein
MPKRDEMLALFDLADRKGFDVTQSSMLAGSERVGLRALRASYPTTGLVEGDYPTIFESVPYLLIIRLRLE